MPLSFWNLERLRVMSACTVLVLGAVTVSSILSTAQMMKPLRILMEQVPRSAEYHPTKFVIMEQVPIISAEYHPAKFVVSYKTFAPDGSLETVTQDSISRKHRRLSQSNTNTNTNTGKTETVDVDNDNQGHDLDQLFTNVDESLYQQSLQANMLDAEDEWEVDDDEGLFFYPKESFVSSEKMALQRKLGGAEPTLVKRQTQEAAETSVTTEILPAVMVGVACAACAVIACAAMLYITELLVLLVKCRHERFMEDSEKRAETASHKHIHPSLTGMGTSASSNISERWVDGRGQRDLALYPMMLPAFPPNSDEVEDMEMALACIPPKHISLTRVSTMSSSLVDGHAWEDRIVPYDCTQAAGGGILEQLAVTDLSDANRVGVRTDLGSFVQSAEKYYERKNGVMASSPTRSGSSRCSSLTDISEGTESTPQLAGEMVLNDEEATPKKKNTASRTSLDFFPDAPSDEERDVVVDSHLGHCAHGDDKEVRESPTSLQTQLEHLIASIPVTDRTGRPSSPTHHNTQVVPIQDYIRDIYFVVGVGTASTQNVVDFDFGLDLLDATCPVTHPSVGAVHAKSPLAGRIFMGDFVLNVNGMDMAGQSAFQVAELLECNSDCDGHHENESGATKSNYKTVVKLTIMSSHADGASDTDGQASLDLGFPDSAVEV